MWGGHQQNGCHSKCIHRKTGLGAHTRWTDTYRLFKKVIVYRIHFVQFRFWFSGIQMQTLICLTSLDLVCACVCACVRVCVRARTCVFSFFTMTSVPSLTIVAQESRNNQTLHISKADRECYFRLYVFSIQTIPKEFHWLSEAKLPS